MGSVSTAPLHICQCQDQRFPSGCRLGLGTRMDKHGVELSSTCIKKPSPARLTAESPAWISQTQLTRKHEKEILSYAPETRGIRSTAVVTAD